MKQQNITITVPIYYKDYVLRARKNPLLGLNWYTAASNTFRKGGKTTTGAAGVKIRFHQMILDNKDEILKESRGWDSNHLNGFHVHYNVYAKRLGTDGSNIRSVIEKFALDGLQEAGLIDNDKYVYSTSSNFYLDRENPRC